MIQKLTAVYRKGAFYPEEAFDFPEDTSFEILIETPNIIPPQVKDPEERKRILHELVQSMRARPLPENAPRLTRDELHERG